MTHKYQLRWYALVIDETGRTIATLYDDNDFPDTDDRDTAEEVFTSFMESKKK